MNFGELMMSKEIIEGIDSIIKDVWLEDLKKDYAENHLLKEDSLKNAFYFHLRMRLGESFLRKNNIRIFTEYYIDGERIDLVIAEIDPLKATEYYLADCVKNVIAVVEMKYKNTHTNKSVLYQDVNKVLSFIEGWGNNTKHYLAFIHEKYYKARDVSNWINKEQAIIVKGKVTELYAYLDADSGESVWSVVQH